MERTSSDGPSHEPPKDAAKLVFVQESGGLPSRPAVQFEYEFISGLDKSYSSRTRRQVLRRHFSKKRKTSKLETRKVDAPTPNLELAKLARRAPSIQTLINESPADPFSCLPLKIDKRQSYLLQHYLNLKVILYGHTSGSFDPFQDILSEFALKSELVLWSALTAASTSVAKLHGKAETLESLNHHTQLIRSLNHQLSALSDDTAYDSAIIATTSLLFIYAIIKTRTPEVSTHQDHTNLYMHGLRQLIIDQGGLMSPKRSRIARCVIYGIDQDTGGELSANLTPVSDHVLSVPAVYNFSGEMIDIGLIPAAIQELLGFYANMYHHALRRSREPRQSSTAIWDGLFPMSGPPQFQVGRLFQPGTPLHWILTQGQRKQWWKGVTALIYLNSVLWDYRNQPVEVVKSFFNQLRHSLIDEGLEYSGSLETFIHIMATGCTDLQPECPARAWLMTRLVRTIKRMSPLLHKRLEESLLSFLMAGPNGDMHGNLDWRPEDFARDVWEDLELTPMRK